MNAGELPGERDIYVFERARPRLRGLAYRMLGTIADADDVVQDAWLRWQATGATTARNPEAWLTTVTTRLALDRLRSNQRRRADYIGPWLPEPLVSDLDLADVGVAGVDPEAAAELADSLTLGFLTLLDELTPVERAVFVLADVFAVPYVEIAAAVGKSEAACRQIASRGRHRLRAATPRSSAAGADRQVIDALMASLAAGDIGGVLSRLAPDVVCVSDGGGQRRAALRPVLGAERVGRFLVNLGQRFAGQFSVRPATVNGDPGVVISLDGVVDVVVAFEVHAEQVAAIRIVRNPDKLGRVGHSVEIE